MNMTMNEAIELVREDRVVIRATDGIAICQTSPDFCSTGRVVSVAPYHVEWNDDNIAIDELPEMLDDGHDNAEEWALAPRPFEQFEIGSVGPFDYQLVG